MGRPVYNYIHIGNDRTHLGKTIDLHCGGKDLIFPHHENEIAHKQVKN